MHALLTLVHDDERILSLASLSYPRANPPPSYYRRSIEYAHH